MFNKPIQDAVDTVANKQFKVVIHPLYSSKIGATRPPLKKEILLEEGYNASQAELRALRWLNYCPNDIVMVVPE